MPTNSKASRQRSFFDQDTKVCRPWIRNSKPPAQPDYSIKPVPNLAPIAVTFESKSKLEAFRFEQRVISPLVDDKGSGMMGPEEGNIQIFDDQDKPQLSQILAHSQSLSQKSTSKEIRECPQTPVGRLPLSELIASGEDVNHQGQNLTPIERVLWNHSQQDENRMTPQAVRMNRKRQHSSSPVSSSQNEASDHFVSEKPSFDLQVLQKSLKTPQADPASDLWSRYSLNTNPNTNRTSPGGLAGANFTINSSSPQTPAKHLQVRDSGGLRRSISCGIEWPVSAAKRRKIQFRSSNPEAEVGFVIPDTGRDENGNSKLARVSLLVEEIQSRLARPYESEDEETTGPSSSAPLPDKSDASTCSTNLQIQPLGTEKLSVALKPDAVPVDCLNRLRDRTALNLKKLGAEQPDFQDVNSSEFGDDDLNFEVLESIDVQADASLPAENLHADPILESKGPKYHSLTPTKLVFSTGTVESPRDYKKEENSGLHIIDSKPTKESLSFPISDYLDLGDTRSFGALIESDDDEFDEDNNGVSAADLEDVVALYDAKPFQHLHQASQPSVNAQNQYEPGDRFSEKSIILPYGQSAQDLPDTVEREAVSEDEFGGDLDFDDIVAECEEASQKPLLASQPLSSNGLKAATIQRYLIMTVAEGTYSNENGVKRSEKVLLIQTEKTKLNKAIILRGFWFDSPCIPGSYVHLIGDFDQYGQCVVDENHNLLIIHPDHLISATVVADSFSCTRRAVLQDRVKATSQTTEPTVYGSMLHEIFQEAMRANRWDTEWLSVTIDGVATRYLESLFEMNVELGRAINHLKSKVVELQAWAEVFVAAKPKPHGTVKDRNGIEALMSVNKLLDVEEKMWSPVYGLKGMVDATVQVVMQDGEEERTLTVPLEVKTGKFPNAAHKAQTALYTLLLSDRYDVEVMYGILYYTETSEISRIPAVRHELIHMIMQRNELACYVRHRLELPPMLKCAHLCGKCYAQTSCFLYHKLVENGDGETSGMGDRFDEVAKHLQATHQQFFRKWDDLITKEEKVILKFRRELWTMQSAEREKVGRCFGGVILDQDLVYEGQVGPKINRFIYAFKKQGLNAGFSFMESQITTGEPIVISDEKGHFALANGYVTQVQKQRIHVAVDRRLHNARIRKNDFDAQRNQVFTGIMEIVEDGMGESTRLPAEPEEEVLYRIDKDEFSNGMATVRNNLIHLMEKNAFGAQALRRLIVDGVAPTFNAASTPQVLANSASQADLNVDQKLAIEKVMSAKDYALVLGMPGTGKTTTIAHIIRALAAQGKSILLTSYTHTAVDNILLKLRNTGVGVFRIGNVAKVHPNVQDFADLAGVPMKTVEEIKSAYGRQVVATTCLGINHPIFNQRVFDYCIVDEASQITLPVCLGPIRMARKFILVGDHYQLPPLVQNKEALEGGLDISLFKMLSDTHPASVVNLEHQYRMCEDIMTLSNTLIYDGRLKCGTPAVANRTLIIPHLNALKHHHHNPSTFLSSAAPKHVCLNPTRGSCWLRDLLDPVVKACFVNTDIMLPASRESESGSRIINSCEATLTAQLVAFLITAGIPPGDIGVITLYRSQLALLKQELPRHHRHSSAVEMHTADRFQGRDKEVVVLSLVRSNEAGNVGDLLKDWRRVNVAFTRARTKLLVVGSKGTMRRNELLARFVALMEGRGWIYNLPKLATEGHLWEAEMSCTQPVQLGRVGTAMRDAEDGLVADGGKLRGAVSSYTTGKENATHAKMKPPAKQGRLDARGLIERRPVLRDIVNDAS